MRGKKDNLSGEKAGKINQALSGKESIRTTFKFLDTTHENLEWLSNFYGITIKEIFDGIFSETSLSHPTKEQVEMKMDLYEQVRIDPELSKKLVTLKYIRKTYVLSRKAQKTLEKTAQNLNTTRDSLAEYMIEFHYFKAEEVKGNRIKALDLIKKLTSKATEVEEEIEELVGSDDPIYEAFFSISTQLINFENNNGPFN
jgi:hypothetical protein